jgi:hypothetical protein
VGLGLPLFRQLRSLGALLPRLGLLQQRRYPAIVRLLRPNVLRQLQGLVPPFGRYSGL